METKPGKSKNNSYFVALIVIIFSLAFAIFAFRQKDQSKKFEEREYYNDRRRNIPPNDNRNNENQQFFHQKGRGVVNTLAVSGKKGSCSELVIILKESPYVKADILNYKIDGLSSMKIKQSREFADTEDSNRAVINNAENISGPSAGSGVYLALLSAFYSDCAIPKNLAITGEFKVEGEEIPTKIKSFPKKYQ
ncbi:19476_t:CDS:2 [Funneliformis geosporum]|uniref:19476_t:CDS:1 n=1 Tax=Funneliformis geosporum TaxID=1117311 RepID=A0A9W4SZE5_9GLOM|nr:19476_t:CDS:2 [Funneliformis geosporum]